MNQENQSTNLPQQPQFVSKYAQQLYQQQQHDVQKQPINASSLQAFNSYSSLNKGGSSMTSSSVASSIVGAHHLQ